MASNHFFGEASESRLMTTHPIWRRTMRRVIKLSPLDMGIPQFGGARTDREQLGLFNAGKSKADGVLKRSEHQPDPNDLDTPFLSHACDFVVYPGPYDGDPKNLERYAVLWGIIRTVAMEECQRYYEETGFLYEPVWGRDWDSDGMLNDQSFDDPYHVELRRVSPAL